MQFIFYFRITRNSCPNIAENLVYSEHCSFSETPLFIYTCLLPVSPLFRIRNCRGRNWAAQRMPKRFIRRHSLRTVERFIRVLIHGNTLRGELCSTSQFPPHKTRTNKTHPKNCRYFCGFKVLTYSGVKNLGDFWGKVSGKRWIHEACIWGTYAWVHMPSYTHMVQ